MPVAQFRAADRIPPLAPLRSIAPAASEQAGSVDDKWSPRRSLGLIVGLSLGFWSLLIFACTAMARALF